MTQTATKYTGPRSFRSAGNHHDAKRNAEAVARRLTAEHGYRFEVRYFDDYNDYSVSGTYEVRPI